MDKYQTKLIKISNEINILKDRLLKLNLENCIDIDESFEDYLSNITGEITINGTIYSNISEVDSMTMSLLHSDFVKDFHIEDTDEYNNICDRIDHLYDVKFELESNELVSEAA